MSKENIIKSIQLGVGAIVFKDDCILLVKRKNPPNENQWAIPGGKVNFSESLKVAVVRELEEETGITVEPSEPIFTFEVINSEQGETYHYVVIDYAAKYICGEVKPADDAQEADWVSRDTFQTLTVNKITVDLLKDKYSFP